MVKRGMLGLALVTASLLLAIWWGAPLIAAVVPLLAGGIAFALFSPPAASIAPEEAPRDSAPSIPSQADLLNGIEEPVLIVRDRRVLLANEAARQVLGSHIEGVDVRLALRHPAAAERLTRGAEAEEGVSRTELAGVGEQDRRWEMTTVRLADGSRFVRLTDRSEAVASEKMRGDFVANASHELRTPLATLIGFLETLQDQEAVSDAKTRSRFINIMSDEARRMQRLIDDLISLSRIEAERFTAPREAVPLLGLIEEVRGSCGRMIEEKESELLVEDQAGQPVALGDRMQLLQLFQNLVVNALKYGRSGTPVTVRLQESGADMLLIRVTDQGEGIAPEHLPRLTERFYRVDAGRSRSVGGTGLGLAIVKHIVSRHRGRLEILSKVGEGTEVRVWLPRAIEAVVIKES
ncbi:MAG TPA: ATP-binding protein [Allosphingosinicella sp.]|uniref:sensor histidine kinase n=1 Tax=Allosphingosinicella sp. TaxID=2823234 RepID=UPI002ED7D912